MKQIGTLVIISNKLPNDVIANITQTKHKSMKQQTKPPQQLTENITSKVKIALFELTDKNVL